jgi:hypothetical protein
VKSTPRGVEEAKTYITSDHHQDYPVASSARVAQKTCLGDIYFIPECLIYVEFPFVFDSGTKRSITVLAVRASQNTGSTTLDARDAGELHPGY